MYNKQVNVYDPTCAFCDRKRTKSTYNGFVYVCDGQCNRSDPALKYSYSTTTPDLNSIVTINNHT